MLFMDLRYYHFWVVGECVFLNCKFKRRRSLLAERKCKVV